MSYPNRLVACNLESLELRRLKRDLLLVFKIRHKLVKLHFGDFFEFAPLVGTRGHRDKLYPKKCKTNRTLASFAFRVTNPWNSLPEDVISSTTLMQFKKGIDSLNDHFTSMLRGRALRDL